MATLQLEPGDEEILAMCSPSSETGTNVQLNGTSGTSVDLSHLTGNPFTFGMSGGASMVVENSELQIGPKIVTNQPVNAVASNGAPFLTVDDLNNDSIDLCTTPTYGLQVNITPKGGVKNGMVRRSDTLLTRDAVPTSHSAVGGIEEPSSLPHVPLNKSVSTPVPLTKETVAAAKGSPPSKLSPSPITPTGGGGGGQQSFVNTTIHNGTQIVINYPDGYTRTGSIDGVSIEELALHLDKFREILIKRYKKSSRTPLLPWHVGRKVVPLEYYYLEPRIFSMDRRGCLETVNIKQLLATNQMETRYAVEGEAGMGKTLLAARLAQSWAEGSDKQMQQFKLVLLVPLADFHDNIETYILENILPSYFDHDTFQAVWNFWRRNEKDILFILDGYDELRKSDKSKIENLISGQDFPNSKVLVTSRPASLESNVTRLVVKGFNEYQISKFIQKYFDDVSNSDCSGTLQSILERHSKYRKLAERPLFCVLLCMLYETDMVQNELPDRMSDMLHKIMLCLIKWREVKNKELQDGINGIPHDFDQAFDAFGKLSVRAIKQDRHRFSEDDVKAINNFDEMIKLGFLYPEEVIDVVKIQTFYKPVHQIFIEYFAALHIAKHVKKCWVGCRQCWRFNSLLEREDSEVLVFTAGILGPYAYRLFDFARFPKLQKLTESKLLILLREAGPHPKNKKVIAKMLDTEQGVITTNEAEIEGWSHLLPEKFTYLRTLEIVWRIKSNHPDQESSFVEASPELLNSFFSAINKNTCIEKLIFRSKQDGAIFTDDKLKIFFSTLHKSLTKKGLKKLEFRDMKIELEHYLRDCFNNTLNSASLDQPGFTELRTINLKTFLSNSDLENICNVLTNSAPQLETLHLHGLELGYEGFTSLAALLKKRNTLHHLYLSMNKALLVNVFGSADSYAPQIMRSDFSQQRLRKNAAKKSHEEFALHNRKERSMDDTSQHSSPTSLSPSYYQESNSSEDGSILPSGRSSPLPGGAYPHPYTEFRFLFDIKNDGLKKVPQARHYWFIKGSEMRLPLPLCMESEHESVFHYLFSALPQTQLRTLSLDQPGFYLTIADLVCLGDAIRSATHLKTLDLQNLSRMKYYMPILIALGQSTSLENVNLSSDRVIVKDAALQLACCALARNTSVQKLTIANWKFILKEKQSALTHIKSVLNSWKVKELNIQHCGVDFSNDNGISQLIFSPPIITTVTPPSVKEYRTVTNINLAQVELSDAGCRRGPLLLPLLRNFTNLQQLDISASPSKPTTVDDSSCLEAFKQLAKITLLRDLTLKYWNFELTDTKELCKALSECQNLKEIKLDNANERRPANMLESCETSFLHALVSSLPSLKYLSICYYTLNDRKMDEQVADWFAKCLHKHWRQCRTKLQVYGVSAHALHSLKFGLMKNFCILRESNIAAHILTVEVYKPVLPF